MVSQGRTTHSILFVSNISSKSTKNSLTKWFQHFGEVKQIQIIEDESIAIVEFATSNEAAAAKSSTNGAHVDGQVVWISQRNAMTSQHLTQLRQSAIKGAVTCAKRDDYGDAGEQWAIAAATGLACGDSLADVKERLTSAAKNFAQDAVHSDTWECVPYDFWKSLSIAEWAGLANEVAKKPRNSWADESSSRPEGLREILDTMVQLYQGHSVEERLVFLSKNAWKTDFAKHVVTPSALVRLALIRSDAVSLQSAIAAYENGHARLVRHELLKNWSGLMYFGLLGPLRTARGLGLGFALDSFYFPTELMD